jgi:hypothetical protein
MFILRILFLTFVGLIFIGLPIASAQIYNKTQGQDQSIVDNPKIVSDSAGFAEKGLDYSVDIYYKNQQGEKLALDTSIDNVHRLGLLNEWDIDLGNTGTAYQSLKARAFLPSQYTLLPNEWNAYRFTNENLRFYNTTKPFSEVAYSSGSKQEQVLELFHTQNISPFWNLSTRYRKINSLGFFSGQRSNIDNFDIISDYVSKNKRYKSQTAFLYNKIQQDENLGIISDTFLTNPNFSNHTIIPIGATVLTNATRSNILNYQRDANLRFSQSYSLGKTSVTYDEDSIRKSNFKPVLTFGNRIFYTGERYCFQNSLVDSTFPSNYLDVIYPLDDTLLIRYDNNTVGADFSAESNIYLKDKVFSVQGGLGIEFQKIGGWAFNKTAVNNYVFGTLSNRKSADSSWVLDASLKLYYTGFAKGNLNFNALLSKALPKNVGRLGIEVSQYIQQPFFISESIQVNQINETKNLQSQINTALGGFYQNEKLQLRLSVTSLLFNQLIYGNGLNPVYENFASAISIQQAQLDKGFSLGKWKMMHKVLLQITPTGTPIQLPLLASFHRFSYQNYLFAGKLQMNTGLDVYFNTPYFNDVYQPIFQSFNPQQTIRKQMIPRLHPFFNFKIKRFRASVSFNHLQHVVVKNNINYLNYAAQNQLFRFALRWIFIN